MRHKPNNSSISYRLWFVWINIIAGVHCTMHTTIAPNVLLAACAHAPFFRSHSIKSNHFIQVYIDIIHRLVDIVGTVWRWQCTASNTDWIRKINCLFHFHAWNRTQAKYTRKTKFRLEYISVSAMISTSVLCERSCNICALDPIPVKSNPNNFADDFFSQRIFDSNRISSSQWQPWFETTSAIFRLAKKNTIQ